MSRSRLPEIPADSWDWLKESSAHLGTKLELANEKKRGRTLEDLFDGKPAVSAREIADVLGVSVRTIERHIASEEVNSFTVGRSRRVFTRDLLAWLHGVPAPPEPGDEILTVAQAAAEVGVHGDTIRRWIHAGRLTHWRAGPRGEFRISRSDLFATVHNRARTETYAQKRTR